MTTAGAYARPVTRIAVIYYSATGNVHALAREVAAGAAAEGADVRLRHVAELAPKMQISFKQHWGRHRSEIEDQPDASIARVTAAVTAAREAGLLERLAAATTSPSNGKG